MTLFKDDGKGNIEVVHEPVSLRDQFAIAAIGALVRSMAAEGYRDAETCAKYSYEIADAMIKAREVKQDD